MFSAQIFCVLAALVCIGSAVPAPATPRTSPMDKRGDGDRFWQSNSNFIDFTRRQTDSLMDSVCDLQNANMPAAPTALPAPATGLQLMHVAIGRGTQNYTCDLSNSTAVPVAIGAVATLFNVSCLAADSPTLLAQLPVIALNLPVPSSSYASSPANVDMSGHHYFTDLTTAYFNLDTTLHQYGQGAFKKVNSSSAPTTAIAGQGGSGYGAVPWLKLDAKSADGTLQEVYRLNTAGGSPPKTCTGQSAAFEIQYSAEYWIWSN